MPIDRDETLRQAERLQRQGRLDLAIAEYVRLVEDHPKDWNSINALGDLYLRSGDVDRAVARFVHIADHLFDEGFFPKAAALYKKALKSKPDHEHVLLRLAEIAAVQELLADARTYLRKVWELRSERGDERGAAACLVRLASLPEADAETVLTGARASRAFGDTEQAVTLFRSAAEQLQKAGRHTAAMDALAQVVALQPHDVALRRELAGQYIAAGQLDSAKELLDVQTAGDAPDLLLALAQIELARMDDDAARSTLTRFITVAPDRSMEVLQLAGQLGRGGDAQRAFNCTEVVVDDAILRSDWDRAVSVLQSFLVHGPHVAALVKLVHVARDAGLDDVVLETQERLAETYLETGRGAEALAAAELLFASAPRSPVHTERLRRALELTGVNDTVHAIQQLRERLASATKPPIERSADAARAPAAEDGFDFDFEVPVVTREVVVEAQSGVAEPRTNADDEEAVEVDLSAALASLGAPGSHVKAAPPAAETDRRPMDPADTAPDFAAMLPKAADSQAVADAVELYERGRQRLESGQVREGLEDLEEAARAPAVRFAAAARLGREYVERGQARAGVEWLERAAEMPAPSRDAGLEILYELGMALDAIGESARALAIFIEIEADEPNYRDVNQRLETLVRMEGERRA